MGSLPRVSVVAGTRRSVPAAPLSKHMVSLASSDRTALNYTDETCNVRVSYSELHARTNALARAIASRARPTGANRDGDYVIAVCMQPTHNTVMTLFATWKAGAAYVPLEPSFPQAHISHILKDAEPALVIYDDSANPSIFVGSGVPSVSFEELSLESADLSADEPKDQELLAEPGVDSVAIVLYTSGSTGVPKGVHLAYSAICNRLWWQFRTFPYSESEATCVWKTSLTFVDSICEIWGPLLNERSLLIPSKETTRDPQKLVQVLAEYQIQRLVLVPTLLRSILMYLSLNPSDRPLQHLKLWVCSGETLSKELAAQFFQYFGDQNGCKLANFYGSTEVMGDVTYYVLENSAQLELHPTIPIGSPLDNCALYLLDEELQPAREAAPGEVWVAGANLAAGYVAAHGTDKFCHNPHAAHPDIMGSLPRVSVVAGTRRSVPAAPLSKHMASLASSDRTALNYTDETCNVRVSYSELHARTNTLARAIASRARPTGANRDGDYVIAVCMQPTHNTVMTLLATWKAGAAYVPLEPSFPQARISHILKDAEPALVIYDDSANSSMFAGSSVPSVSFEELSLESADLSADEPKDQELLAEPGVDSVAIVLYTSGSTGVSKGVRLAYSAICNRLWWQFRTFPYSESEATCVWKTSLTFGDSICEMWGPLLNGRSLLILSKETTRDPQKLVQVLAEYQVQRLVLVPTLLRSVLMYLSLNPSDRPLRHMKLWVCSGETLSKELAAQFFQYFGDQNGCKLANFYGSTEVMGDVTYYFLENSAQLELHPTVPIGSPLDNCALYLLDEELKPAREAAPGEVWVAGANLAAGYVTAQGTDKFCHNPHAAHPDFSRLFRTGDFGILQKGVILYAGRTDSQVKIRGHRVDLLEVDRAVSAVQGVEKSVVLCYGLERGNPEILAFVTIKPDTRITAHCIEATLKNSLIHYMLPQVIVIDNVPLLVSGKVDRQALLKMYENTNNNDDTAIPLDIDYTGVQPEQMDKARVLFETVGEVLGRAARGALSVRAGFYELGGNSLNSIYTITKLREKGYYIQISDFLGASNLGDVLSKLSTSPHCDGEGNEPKFTAESMRDEHKQQVIDMIVTSFYEKAGMKEFIKHEKGTQHYADCISACWVALLQARLSVVLNDASSAPIAVALNFDAREQPEIELCGGHAKIMALLEHVKGSVKDTMLPEGKGAILHSYMMATASSLSPRDNVAAIYALEQATIRIARDRRFKAVFTTNTSPLTQQLGTDVLGFKTLLDYQINQYMQDDGERPFGKAPDDMRAIVCWKPVE